MKRWIALAVTLILGCVLTGCAQLSNIAGSARNQ